MSISSGTEFNNASLSSGSKQYALQRQLQQTQAAKKEKANELSSDQASNLANVTTPVTDNEADRYVAAAAELLKDAPVMDKKVKKDMPSMEQAYQNSLEASYDNAHNMIASGFYSAAATGLKAAMDMAGADSEKLAGIRKTAKDNSIKKVDMGFERLADAQAKMDIYAS